MLNTAAALEAWFSRFGWPVYGANDVPARAPLPYITVQVKEPEYTEKASVQVQLWARTRENAALIGMADTICGAVGVGVRIPFDGGLAVLWPDSPLQQTLPNGDVRRVLILLQLNSYHCPGV